ncbi:hypothetical protein FSARC_2700 [Fusarium sarcochroum]|uniref:Fungal N-terminal domain-containing protein n=1 Tax=Fusarium sarcochroum TaxID=1208366 RepID=A0A8H4U608_9HYPO|nr:hypothetical protein FSARC_2700 [Fusarium sarcochroum]
MIDRLIYESALPAYDKPPTPESEGQIRLCEGLLEPSTPPLYPSPLNASYTCANLGRVGMAEPLSIASGVAGLISLGLTLCNGLHTYFSAIKDRDKDVEIATQNLALFRLNIEVIESSTLKLANRRTLAADGVNRGLKNCESQLKTLETFIQELASTDGLSGAKQQWRKQKMIARYPFDQKRLAQLQEQLSEANNTLSTFIQTLNLEVNIGTNNNLQIMDKDMKANDSTMLDLLSSISTRLDVIGPTVQRTEMQITTLPTRVREQTVTANTSPALLHEVNSKLPERQPVPNSGQRPFGGLAEYGLRPRYLRNSEAEGRLCSSLTITECTCMGATNRPISRRSSRVYQFWGGLAISRQGRLQSSHRPGCIFYNHSPRKSWKTTLTYSGLRSILSQSFTISVSQDYPAGTYSLLFGLQPCNIVENSPAFRLFGWGTRGEKVSILRESLEKVGPIGMTKKLIQDLRVIYGSGNASPYDVDEYGNNIAYACLRTYLYWHFTDDELLDAIWMLLAFFYDIGVPMTASSFQGGTTMDLAVAVGFSDIFLTVMRKDLPKLETILNDRNLHTDLFDEDLYGRNILHISSGWAAGLRLILGYEATHLLLNTISIYDLSPLDYALLHSGILCNAPDQWTLCNDCSCYVTAKLFLEADCSVTIGDMRPRTLRACSLRARILFFEHLRNRRERLRRISLAQLPVEILRQYGITTKSLPDATAMVLWDELQKRANDWAQGEVVLSDSLEPYSGYVHEPYSGYVHEPGPRSFFNYPQALEVAELALNYGFHPVEECGLQSFMSRVLISPDARELDISYANWLFQQDVKIDFSIGPFQLAAVHRAGALLGTWMRQCCSGPHFFPKVSLNKFGNILSMISRSEKHPVYGFETVYLARCAIHALTMRFLECQEECTEMLDEDQFLINRLHDLDEEFGTKFQRQNVSIASFLRGYWLERMEEVGRDLDRALTDEQRSDLVHVGVVLDEDGVRGFQDSFEK